MHHVKRRLDTRESGAQGLGLQAVSSDDLRRLADAAREELRPAGQAAHAVTVRFERRQEAAADVAGRAGEEDHGKTLQHGPFRLP